MTIIAYNYFTKLWTYLYNCRYWWVWGWCW